MYIPRTIHNTLISDLDKSKIIILYGARQVGKTTLIQHILDNLDIKTVSISGERSEYIGAFSARKLQLMIEVVGNNDLLFIDEAQNITSIGENIKILHDAHPKLKIILTGSSSFELANRTREPLTGRTITFQLYPLSMSELMYDQTPFEVKQRLDQFLIYGSYPSIALLESRIDKINFLKELVDAYLYKDVLQLTSIKHTDLIHKLLKLIGLQIGGLVSLQEIANSLNIGFDTVRSYIEILEKAFVLKVFSGYSTNPRKEISKMDKIYFVDNGIRNAVLNDFREIDSRNDTGALWENFLIMERSKKLEYSRDHAAQFFWRKYSGAEIDYIEEKDAQVTGFEFKWGRKRSRSGFSWKNDYPQAQFEIVNRENYLGFIA